MKSRKEMRKPAKEIFASSDDLKKARKLKPVKKEKNPKRTFLEEIDDLEDIEMDYPKDEFEDEDFFDDDDE
ncbi:MAG: hypothetical protein CVT95_13075 [Bacteroidetes bacterium HGW-Bacteroidetes-12]|nr:MAG: hypothetical protein CVT95_13075 [Bacteroidetes bacterium HGW-Bacteroidetes-12]